MALKFENIPKELKEYNQWVMWKLITKKGEEKPTKIPYTTQNTEAKSTDPNTWSSFEDCLIAHKTGLYHGIGFVFSSGDGYLGFDYDDVRDPVTGEIDPEILQEIIDLKSYAEVSQSGKGVHVICKGKKPGGRCRSGCREMYTEGRFFVMTGNHIPWTPTSVNNASIKAIQAVYDKIDTKREKTNSQTLPSKFVKSPKLTDDEVISLQMGAKNADKFEALWDGNTSAYGGDDSAADQAFCGFLAFYTQDQNQIYRLVRRSGLYREKWEREDYRNRTIQNAIDGLTATYKPHSIKEDNIDNIISGLDKTGSPIAKAERAKETFGKLSSLPNSTRKVGCKQVWKALKLDTTVFKDAYEEVFPSKPNEADKADKKDINRLDVYTDDVIKQANFILDKGLFWDILLKVHDKYHVGDSNIKRLCAISYATGYITTANGIQLKPSGGSGKGKTHIFDSFVTLVPPHTVFRGSMSGMSAYFNDDDDSLIDAMVFLLDDTDLNRTEGLKNTIKRASSNFQKRTQHRTVVKGKGKTVELPARDRWWISSVDGVDDDQLGNRFIGVDVDCSPEQDIRVHEWQKQQHLYGTVPDDDFDVQVCRCCYDILGKETYRIVIPFTEAIHWNNIDNRRNYPMFEDFVMGITFYYIRQRKQVDGVYWATVEDCEKAIEIYRLIEEQNATNLTATETDLLKWMGDKFRVGQWVDRNQIQRYTKLSDKGVRDLLHGHDGNGGLLAKFPPLERDRHKTESSSVEKFVYRMTKPFKVYTDIVSLDYTAIDAAIEEYSQSVGGSTCSSSIVLQTTTSFSQTVDSICSEVVVNHRFSLGKKEDISSSACECKKTSLNHVYGKQDFTTTFHENEADDVVNGAVDGTTTELLPGTSTYCMWFTPEKATQLTEKVTNWEKANSKITVEMIPRATFDIARMMREHNLGFVETYLLQYTSTESTGVI